MLQVREYTVRNRLARRVLLPCASSNGAAQPVTLTWSLRDLESEGQAGRWFWTGRHCDTL